LSQRGLSLIEIMFALSILSIVLLALGGLMFEVARHTRHAAGVSYRSAATESAVSWLRSLPWDSIPTAVGCEVSLMAGQLEYTRCVDLLDNNIRYRVARITITPTGTLQPRPDTVEIERTNTRPISPFSPP
jgi:prepilin-type N-terminal cleavage/methylation domain-containing protein